MRVTSVVVMVYVFDQTWSVIDTITAERDLMKLTVVSNHLQIKQENSIPNCLINNTICSYVSYA